MRRLLLILLLLSSALKSNAQGPLKDTIIMYGGFFPLNAYVYHGDPDAPLLIWYPGLGESEGAKEKLLLYGPAYWLDNGLVPTFTVNGVTKTYNFATCMLGAFPDNAVVEDVTTRIRSAFTYDETRLSIGGWSAGGQESMYFRDDTDWGDIVNLCINYQGVTIGPTGAGLMGVYADRGGKFIGIEGIDDPGRDINQISDTMNAHIPASAVYDLITSGDGSTHSGPGANRISDTSYHIFENYSIWTYPMAYPRGVIPDGPPAPSTNLINVNWENIFDMNGRVGKGLRGLFDGNLATNYDINKITDVVADFPFISRLVLDSVYTNMQIEHYDNFDAGTIEVICRNVRLEPIDTFTMVRGTAAQWNTLNIQTSDSVRFIDFIYDDISVGIFEFNVYGDAQGLAPSIYRNIEILPKPDPGKYGFGICDLDNRLNQYDKNGDTILPKMAGTFRVGYPGPEFQYFPEGWSLPLTEGPIYVGRFGTNYITNRVRNFASFYDLHAQLYNTGGDFKYGDSLSLVGSNNSYLSDPYNTYKWIEPGADSTDPVSWHGWGHMWKGLISLYGTNTLADTTGFVFIGGSDVIGQGGINLFELGNELTRDFAGKQAYHSPKVYYALLEGVYPKCQEADSMAKAYMGALTFMDTTFWKAMYMYHYEKHGLAPFPTNGFNFNIYMSDLYDGQGGTQAISPERFQFYQRMVKLKGMFNRLFPNAGLRITEYGFATAGDSPFHVDSIGLKPPDEVAADFSLRVSALSQMTSFPEVTMYYAAFADGSYIFNSMTTVIDDFDPPPGALVTKVGYALGNQFTVEKDYNYYGTLVVNGDSTSTNVGMKTHPTQNKKLFKLWNGTDNGTVANDYVVNVGSGAMSATLHTLRYDSYNPTSTPVSVVGNNVTVDVTESMQWLEVSYEPTKSPTFRNILRNVKFIN